MDRQELRPQDNDQDPIVKAYVPGLGVRPMRLSERTSGGYSAPPAPNPHNLTPWKPGQSGNPAGPPRGHVKLVPVLNDLLQLAPDQIESEHFKPATAGEKLVRAMYLTAIEPSHWGDRARADILDRTDGPVSRDTGSVLLEEYAAFQRQVIDAFLHSLNVIDAADTPALSDAETATE